MNNPTITIEREKLAKAFAFQMAMFAEELTGKPVEQSDLEEVKNMLIQENLDTFIDEMSHGYDNPDERLEEDEEFDFDTEVEGAAISQYEEAKQTANSIIA